MKLDRIPARWAVKSAVLKSNVAARIADTENALGIRLLSYSQQTESS